MTSHNGFAGRHRNGDKRRPAHGKAPESGGGDGTSLLTAPAADPWMGSPDFDWPGNQPRPPQGNYPYPGAPTGGGAAPYRETAAQYQDPRRPPGSRPEAVAQPSNAGPRSGAMPPYGHPSGPMRQYNPPPPGTAPQYNRPAAPARQYDHPSGPMRQYNPPSGPMPQYNQASGPMRQYSAPPPGPAARYNHPSGPLPQYDPPLAAPTPQYNHPSGPMPQTLARLTAVQAGSSSLTRLRSFDHRVQLATAAVETELKLLHKALAMPPAPSQG